MTIRGRRAVHEPGRPAGDLAPRLGLTDAEVQRRFRDDLDRVRDAELRAEYDSEGIRLR